MPTPAPAVPPGEAMLDAAVRQGGFAFVGHADMRALLKQHAARQHAARQQVARQHVPQQHIEPGRGLQDWAGFAASWGDLAPDSYLAAVGLQRRRRHAVFSALPGGPVQPSPHQPHYQSLHYNRLQGDLKRWFEPVAPSVIDSISLRTILGFSRALFDRLASAPPEWHIEIHQFRIEARADEAGQPTPEGMHRDGVDYVLVLLVDRENIVSGMTTIHDGDGRELGSFTLSQPLDAALVDDARVYHGVTAVTPLDPALPAHRDVLVVTFRAMDTASNTTSVTPV